MNDTFSLNWFYLIFKLNCVWLFSLVHTLVHHDLQLLLVDDASGIFMRLISHCFWCSYAHSFRAGGCGVTGTWFLEAPLWQAQVDRWQLDLLPLILPVQYPCSLDVLDSHHFHYLSLRGIAIINTSHLNIKVSDLYISSISSIPCIWNRLYLLLFKYLSNALSLWWTHSSTFHQHTLYLTSYISLHTSLLCFCNCLHCCMPYISPYLCSLHLPLHIRVQFSGFPKPKRARDNQC